MKRLTYSLAILFVAAIAFAICGDVVMAADAPAPAAPAPGADGGNAPGGGGGGGRRNFDPAQMRERLSQMMKDRLGASDDEWKVIEPRVTKVMELQPRPGGGMFGGGRRGGNGGGAPGGAAPDAQAGGGQGGRGGMFGGTPMPEADALQKVLDNKDSTNDQIKAATKSYRDALEKRDKELQKARQDLREVLSVRQEAQLVLMRILD